MDSRFIGQAQRDIRSLPPIPFGKCWFCLRLLLPGQAISQHHPIAQRYLEELQSIPPGFELVLDAHCLCHALWHSRHDAKRVSWRKYRPAMRQLNYGYGVFAHDEWLNRGYRPANLRKFWDPFHPLLTPHPVALQAWKSDWPLYLALPEHATIDPMPDSATIALFQGGRTEDKSVAD